MVSPGANIQVRVLLPRTETPPRNRSMNWRTIWLVCLGGLLLAGCHRVHDEKSFKVIPGDVKVFEVPASTGEQKVEVQVTATTPVHVYIVPDQERQDAETKPTFDKSKAVEAKQNVTNDTLKATVPANKKYGVV